MANDTGQVGLLARYDVAGGAAYGVVYSRGNQRRELYRGTTYLVSSGAKGSYPLTVGATYHLKWTIRNGAKAFSVQGPNDPAYVQQLSSADNQVAGSGQVGVTLNSGVTGSDSVSYHLDNLQVVPPGVPPT